MSTGLSQISQQHTSLPIHSIGCMTLELISTHNWAHPHTQINCSKDRDQPDKLAQPLYAICFTFAPQLYLSTLPP